jgi:hypothetical protein
MLRLSALRFYSEPPLLRVGHAGLRAGRSTTALPDHVDKPVYHIPAIGFLRAEFPAVSTISPFFAIRAPAVRSGRTRTASGRLGERRTLKRSCAALETFLHPAGAARPDVGLGLVERDLVCDFDHGWPGASAPLRQSSLVAACIL